MQGRRRRGRQRQGSRAETVPLWAARVEAARVVADTEAVARVEAAPVGAAKAEVNVRTAETEVEARVETAQVEAEVAEVARVKVAPVVVGPVGAVREDAA